ncbi:MAG TPA: peptidyl-tRNA hydrolase Pth2 [archaeon]|nr:peptidyl-tRNA hydrolase Pth2 [archaeon]
MTYKQVIVFRKDLLRDIGKGKMAAHVAHASVGSFCLADDEAKEKWEKNGSEKVVLKVNGMKEIRELHKRAKETKLPCFLVRDAGLTQLKSGTVTCLAIGPAEEKKIDKITGKLKLL